MALMPVYRGTKTVRPGVPQAPTFSPSPGPVRSPTRYPSQGMGYDGSMAGGSMAGGPSFAPLPPMAPATGPMVDSLPGGGAQSKVNLPAGFGPAGPPAGNMRKLARRRGQERLFGMPQTPYNLNFGMTNQL